MLASVYRISWTLSITFRDTLLCGREDFEADELLQNWFVRHLQIIGEAARLLPEEIRATAPDIAWSKIIGMRHILVHNYFGIDTQVVWDAVERDVPNLKEKITSLLQQLNE